MKLVVCASIHIVTCCQWRLHTTPYNGPRDKTLISIWHNPKHQLFLHDHIPQPPAKEAVYLCACAGLCLLIGNPIIYCSFPTRFKVGQ